MNIEEENSCQGNMTTSTPEAELLVELNSDVLKNLQSLQAELKSFREDNLNERKEQQVINEALLRNMMGGSLQGKPTQSTNSSKREPYPKRASSLRREEKNNLCLKH